MAEPGNLHSSLSTVTDSSRDSSSSKMPSRGPSLKKAEHTKEFDLPSSSTDEYDDLEEVDVPSFKPAAFLENPDKKDQYGGKSSSHVLKAGRYMLTTTVQLWKPLIVVTLWSAASVWISTAASASLPPAKRNACRYLCSPVAFDNTVAAYVGLALFLLLGFRVNEAYGRFERGLQIWNETITTSCCGFANLVGTFYPEGTWHRHDRKRLFGWLAAFPVTLKRKLRGESDISELRSVLSAEDMTKLKGASNMPAYCLGILNAYMTEARKKEGEKLFVVTLLRSIGALSLAMNKCENIARFSVNYGYIAHLRMFIAIWIFMLPFSLVQDCGWYTVLLVPLIAFGVLGTEKIAEELTQPFGYDFNDIPIGLISNEILQSIRSKYIVLRSDSNSLVHESQTPDPEDFL